MAKRNQLGYRDIESRLEQLKHRCVEAHEVGYHKDREHAIVEVKDIHYEHENKEVIYHLGMVLEHVK